MVKKIDTPKNSDFLPSSLSPYDEKLKNIVMQLHSDKPSEEMMSEEIEYKQRKPKFNWGSLRTKAMAIAILIGTLPVVGTGIFAYNLSNQSINKQISENQEAQALSVADKLHRFIFDRYGDLQVLSNLTILSNPKVRASASVEEKEAVLNQYVNIYKVYDSIAVYDLQGKVIAQSDAVAPKNASDREYFQSVIKTGRPYIEQPRLGVNEELSIFMAAPIKDVTTGETIAVVRTRMPAKVLEQILPVDGKSGYEYHLIDGKGTFFWANETQQIGRNADSDFPGLARLRAVHNPDTFVTIDKIDNAQQLVSYVPLKPTEGLPNLNWQVLVASDTAVAFAIQRQLLLTIAIATGVTALLVGAIAALLAKRATSSIVDATDAVQQLAQGNLDARIDIEGDDEIAVLGTNINQMALKLQEQIVRQAAEAEQVKVFTDIMLSIRQSMNLEDLLQTTVTEARRALKADRVVIYRFTHDMGGYIATESVLSGWPEALRNSIEDPCIGKELIEAYKRGRVVATKNVFETDFSIDHLKLMERLQIKSNLVTPIITGDTLFGLLIAHHCSEIHEWEPYEINFLTQLGTQLGLTLDRVALLEHTQVLKDIAIHTSESLNPQDIFNASVHDIRKAMKADRVVVYLFDEQWRGTIAAESVVSGWPRALGAEIHDPCFVNYVEKYKRGRVVATDNIYKAGLTSCYLKQLEPFAVKANLVAPILIGDNLMGLLIAHQCSSPRAWQPSEIDLFEQLARQIGMGLERASLLEATELARQAAVSASNEVRQQKEELQQQLLQLLQDIEGAAMGDLTVRAEVTVGEIGTVADFFNSIVENLRDIVTKVKDSAAQVNYAIGGNEGAIHQLADQAIKQAEEISYTLDSVDQMVLSIQAVADSAQQAASVARTASQTAASGGTAMNLTVQNILHLRETIGETAKKVKRLGESSQEISKVVSLINQIAVQTNLLAINAGIEAARAGEEGKGFAVVAEEVASLAERSASATQEIEQLVANIQMETSEVVRAMEMGTSQVVEGTRLVEDTKQSLRQIIDVSHQIDQLVQSISSATDSQVETSEAVTKLMKEIAQTSEVTSKFSRQVSESLHQTIEISQELQESVGAFKIN